MTATPRSSRLDWLDWLRGIAVIVMIEAHTVDAWTMAGERHTHAFGRALMVGGMAAPLFLFLAGVAVVLAAESRAIRLGDPVAAARSVRRRGWQVFGLAFLFRLQSYLLNPAGQVDGLLKVDILNVMGPSIVLAGWLWQWGRTRTNRAILLTLATLAATLVTPLVRVSPLVASVPDVLEAYLRPLPGRSNFTLFPWAGFVTAGAAAGLAIALAKERMRLGTAAAWFSVVGAVLVLAGYGGSFLPSPYPVSAFWTTSPSFFCLRVGLLSAALGLAWAWEARRWRFSPVSIVRELGASSLFVYWIHVEMVYGALTLPLRRNLSLTGTLVGWAVMCLAMWGCVRLKTVVVARWKGPRLSPTGGPAPTLAG